ncbi:kinase-like domain-containing protein [Rhizophagus irregularis DAOM 181602=DAOM 197198]|nr:kinase-like domain-containing protein [Rhizophagus irregularis DAOM 181602=DAOM 197198]
MIILPPTRRQLFADSKHDDICKEIRPEIYEPEAPKCYIDLIRRCWDPNPEIEEMIFSFQESYYGNDHEFNEQFREAEKYRKIILRKIMILIISHLYISVA